VCRHELQVGAEHVRGGVGESALLVALPAEAAHHVLPVDGLLEDVGHVAHALLQSMTRRAQALAEELHRQHDDRRGDEGDQRQLPLQIQHPGEQADDGQSVLDDHQEHVRSALGEIVRVERDLGDERAGSLLVVVARRQAHELVEHLVAHVHHHLAADPGERDGRREGGDAANHEQHHDQHGHEADGFQILLDEASVESGLEQRRQRRLGGRQHHHGEHGKRENAPVRHHVAQQTQIELLAGHSVDGGGVGLSVGHWQRMPADAVNSP
jgi:hypothetical protein